jgi:hypothetical protein
VASVGLRNPANRKRVVALSAEQFREKDHTVPPSITRATLKLYRKSPAVTEFRQFTGRGHSLALDSGWREVADAALSWLRQHAAPAAA